MAKKTFTLTFEGEENDVNYVGSQVSRFAETNFVPLLVKIDSDDGQIYPPPVAKSEQAA